MPIKSFADIDNMIAAYKRSNTPQVRNHSTPASGYWTTSSQGSLNEGTYSRSSSSSSSPVSPSAPCMSRSTRVIGAADMLDENGYFNSSRQLLK
jgi:hypothetical protein